jgi:hypothetical protein
MDLRVIETDLDFRTGFQGFGSGCSWIWKKVIQGSGRGNSRIWKKAVHRFGIGLFMDLEEVGSWTGF